MSKTFANLYIYIYLFSSSPRAVVASHCYAQERPSLQQINGRQALVQMIKLNGPIILYRGLRASVSIMKRLINQKILMRLT
jgi:hypothetical protein